jgi:predicted metal-dependent hydrolase
VTKNNTINLDVNLMKTPEDIIDYIIIHELCHFKIQGHSYLFWNYLKQFVPNYIQKIEWLKEIHPVRSLKIQ